MSHGSVQEWGGGTVYGTPQRHTRQQPRQEIRGKKTAGLKTTGLVEEYDSSSSDDIPAPSPLKPTGKKKKTGAKSHDSRRSKVKRMKEMLDAESIYLRKRLDNVRNKHSDLSPFMDRLRLCLNSDYIYNTLFDREVFLSKVTKLQLHFIKGRLHLYHYF